MLTQESCAVTFSDQVVGQVALLTTVLLFCPQSLSLLGMKGNDWKRILLSNP